MTSTRIVVGPRGPRGPAGVGRPGAKIKGGNITVKPGGGSWGGLWSEWDWDNWIKPQIDRAAALGMNAVRLIGNPGIVFYGATGGWSAISQATYDLRWKQVAAYCQTIGLFLYPCLTEKWAFSDGAGGYNFTSAPAIAAIASSAQALAGYPNVIGFDVFQEGSGSAEGLTVSDVLAVYAAIRTASPGVPLTTSSSSAGFGAVADFWGDRTSLPYQIWTAVGGSDFVDLHVYLDAPLVGDMDHIAQVGLPVILGEYGTTQDVASSTQVARFTAVGDCHARPGVLGSFVWALADQGTTPSDQSGVWDNTGYAAGVPLSTTAGKRAALTNIIDRMATMHTPERTHTPINRLPARATRVNLLSAWAEGANTARSVSALGVAMVANATGDTRLGTSYANGGSAAVALDTWYRVDVEVLSSVAGVTIGARLDWLTDAGVYVTNTATASGVSATLTPVRLSLIVKTPVSGVAYANLSLSSTGSTAGTSHTILSEPPPRIIRLS